MTRKSPSSTLDESTVRDKAISFAHKIIDGGATQTEDFVFKALKYLMAGSQGWSQLHTDPVKRKKYFDHVVYNRLTYMRSVFYRATNESISDPFLRIAYTNFCSSKGESILPKNI